MSVPDRLGWLLLCSCSWRFPPSHESCVVDYKYVRAALDLPPIVIFVNDVLNIALRLSNRLRWQPVFFTQHDVQTGRAFWYRQTRQQKQVGFVQLQGLRQMQQVICCGLLYLILFQALNRHAANTTRGFQLPDRQAGRLTCLTKHLTERWLWRAFVASVVGYVVHLSLPLLFTYLHY